MPYSDEAYEKLKQRIEKDTFNDIDGYYLDINSSLCKRIFRKWHLQTKELEEWQKTVNYMDQYDKNLRARVQTSKNINYTNITHEK